MTFSRKDTNKSARGAQAERLAEQFLQGQGLVCIERNYRCAVGEIDLIMRDGNMLVFVEVRLRSNRFFTQAAESVNYRKQHKITRAAQYFLLTHKLTDKVPCRFDVIALDGMQTASIDWIKSAFNAA